MKFKRNTNSPSNDSPSNAPPEGMETNMVFVTPEMAAKFLSRNTKNRELRPGWVKQLTAMLLNGEMLPSHQGIAFDPNGWLLDGQHRLHAMVAANKGHWLNVTTNAPPESYVGIDTQKPRSVADAAGVSTGLAAVANTLARVSWDGSPPTRAFQLKVVNAVAGEHHRLVTYCSTTRRGVISAIAAAAVVRAISSGSDEYPFIAFRSIVLERYDDMTSTVAAFNRQINASHSSAGGRGHMMRMYAAAITAFNEQSPHLSRIIIKSFEPACILARQVLRSKGLEFPDRFEDR